MTTVQFDKKKGKFKDRGEIHAEGQAYEKPEYRCLADF